MRFGQILLASVGLMAVSTAALAFQEQQGAAGAATSAAPSAVAKPAAQFATGAGVKSEQAGTEVRIPGLGKLGVLPKMDFGLELLYGAAGEAKAEAVTPGPSTDDGDLRIRGTVKHRF